MLNAGAAGGPASGVRLATISALDKTAQWEVDIDIFAGWGFDMTVALVLYLLKSFKADQTFMVAFSQGNVPIRHFYIATFAKSPERPKPVFHARHT